MTQKEREKIQSAHGGDIYRNPGVLDFSSNISPLGMPAGVRDGAYQGLLQADYYPDATCERLRNSLSNALSIPEEFILCGNGAADLIYALCLAVKPKKGLVIAPGFGEYEKALRSVGSSLSFYNLQEEQNFIVGEDFISTIEEEQPDILFFCNPSNPIGTLTDLGFLERVLNVCDREGILLVVDECFLDFVKEATHYSMKKFICKSSNLFILKAFTKIYAMAGLRLGYGITSNQTLLWKMKEVTQEWSVSTPAQWAGIAALQEEQYVGQVQEVVKKEREYLKKGLLSLSLKPYPSAANYLFFHGRKGLYTKCLERGILIRDCSNYRNLSDGYYRIAVKDRKSNERLLKVFSEILE